MAAMASSSVSPVALTFFNDFLSQLVWPNCFADQNAQSLIGSNMQQMNHDLYMSREMRMAVMDKHPLLPIGANTAAVVAWQQALTSP